MSDKGEVAAGIVTCDKGHKYYKNQPAHILNIKCPNCGINKICDKLRGWIDGFYNLKAKDRKLKAEVRALRKVGA